jgi:HSP20 family protein
VGWGAIHAWLDPCKWALAIEEARMDIEQTIDRVEKLYSAVTGKRPPQRGNGAHAPIPPETDPARHVEEQLGRLASAIDAITRSPSPVAPAWTPMLAAWEDESATEIVVDVPGVSRDRLEILVDGRALTIRGERRVPWGAARPTSIRTCELATGAFVRTIALPWSVEREQVAAELRDGVLAIRIARPMRPDAGHTIPIKA